MELGGRSEIPYIYMYMGGLYQKRATLKTMRVILVIIYFEINAFGNVRFFLLES